MLKVSAAGRAVTATAVVALALGLPACGGSSQKPATRSTASLTTTASPTTTSTQTSSTRTTKPKPRTTTTQGGRSTTTQSTTTPTTTSTTRTTPTTRTTATTTTRASQPYTPPLRVVLTAANHAPVVNADWSYTVTVVDAAGRKLSGTETTHYLYNGAIVGTEKPTNVPFKNGVYHDTIQFPPASVGYPLVVRTVVHTSIGTGHADWPVKVKKA